MEKPHAIESFLCCHQWSLIPSSVPHLDFLVISNWMFLRCSIGIKNIPIYLETKGTFRLLPLELLQLWHLLHGTYQKNEPLPGGLTQICREGLRLSCLPLQVPLILPNTASFALWGSITRNYVECRTCSSVLHRSQMMKNDMKTSSQGTACVVVANPQ